MPWRSAFDCKAKVTWGLTRLRCESKFRPMLAAESKVATNATPGSPGVHANRSWKHLVEPVEPFLDAVSRQLVRQVREFDPQIVPYARYALDGNGKHLRPTLVALASRACGR